MLRSNRLLDLNSDVEYGSVTDLGLRSSKQELLSTISEDAVMIIADIAFAAAGVGFLFIYLIGDGVIKKDLRGEVVSMDADLEMNMHSPTWIPTWIDGREFCLPI